MNIGGIVKWLNLILIFSISAKFNFVVGQISFFTTHQSATLNYAVDRFESLTSCALKKSSDRNSASLILMVGEMESEDQRSDPSIILKPEGFQLINKKSQILLYAGDSIGAMHGMLKLAHHYQVNSDFSSVKSQVVNPKFSFRAIKFNLPWSSYRYGEVMDLHLSVARDLSFWEEFLDMMTENRFNKLTLWNRHPFPFLIRARNFPEATPFNEPELAEWKHFWTQLFAMAKVRGIETYLVNWNIIVSPQFAAYHGVKELNDTSALVKQYTKESVTQVLNEYPDLTGLGVTLADWMNDMTPQQRETWIEDTFVVGIKAAARPAKFIHRSVLAGSPLAMRKVINAADLPDPVHVEIKFNWSHGHSTPELAITHDYESGKIDPRFWQPFPENYRIEWMIRNEDFFILRWGQPDFIRAHLAANDDPYVDGYFIGSEGYIPAIDYSHRNDGHRTWQYAFEKQWMFYHLWGHLLYNPETPDQFFESTIEARYGNGTGSRLLDAYRKVSSVPLKIASFYAGTWDYTLYSEGFLSPVPARGLNDGHSSFISIDELINHETLDPNLISIRDFVANPEEGDGKKDPLVLANELENDCHYGLSLVKELKQFSSRYEEEFTCELMDLETWAWLGLYFADKLRAGVALQKARINGDPSAREMAIELLTECVNHWDQVIELTDTHYLEVPYLSGQNFSWVKGKIDAHTFSWKKYRDEVRRDLDLALK